MAAAAAAASRLHGMPVSAEARGKPRGLFKEESYLVPLACSTAWHPLHLLRALAAWSAAIAPAKPQHSCCPRTYHQTEARRPCMPSASRHHRPGELSTCSREEQIG